MRAKDFWERIKENKTPGTAILHSEFDKMVKAKDQVLEVGSGSGRIVDICLEKKAKVIAVDINTEEIDALKRRYQFNDNVTVKELDITKDIAARPSSVDSAIMLGLLGALDSPKERVTSLKNIAKSIKPRGFLFISEFEYYPKDKTLKDRYDRGVLQGLEKGSFLVDSKNGFSSYITHNFELDELKALVEREFEIIDLERRTFMSYHGNKRVGMALIARKV